MRAVLSWSFVLALTAITSIAIWNRQQTVAAARTDLAGSARPPTSLPEAFLAPDLQVLREQMKEVHSLRAERDRLRAQLMRKSTPPPPKPKTTHAWRNAGRNTPMDTLHTVIWSSVTGEIGELRQALMFDAKAEAAAKRLFDELPAEEQVEYGDPMTVVAILLSGRMPLDLHEPELVRQIQESPQRVQVQARVKRAAGARTEKTYHLQHDGRGWRVLVPPEVINRYREMLAAP